MNVCMIEGGVVCRYKGDTALMLAERLVRLFPSKYRFVLRDNVNTIVECIQ